MVRYSILVLGTLLGCYLRIPYSKDRRFPLQSNEVVMAGSYEKCMARLRKPDGRNHWTCYKKKGHHLSVGRDNRKHVDNKQAPAFYWESSLPGCMYASVAPCTEPPDEYHPRHSEGSDNEVYCDLHWIEILDKRSKLARKGVY